MLPVLTQVGPDADDESRDDTCPSCQQKDGIRFLGSAIATLLSVTLSTMFGDEALDPREKKALVFTDSVQDAAHRAGFVESRSHTLTLRALLRHAVGDHPVALDSLVDQAIAAAGDDQFRRYRIIPPDLVERDEFAPFWRRLRAREIPARVRTRVRRRLLFDAVLEFGLQSRVGRTLEQTGSAVAEVDAGQPSALASIARAVINATDVQDTLDKELNKLPDSGSSAWVRGVLEHMRDAGRHRARVVPEFIRHDGNRYFIWGGRPRGQGMPAFPRGRSAPAFPRIGPAAKVKDPLLDPVSSPQSWYARWTARTLGVPAGHGARLARQLLERLARADVLHTVATEGGGTVFTIPASAVVVSPACRRDGRRGQPAHLQRLPDSAAGHRHGRRPARRGAVHARALPRDGCAASRGRTTTTAVCTRRRTCAGSSPGSTPSLFDDATRLQYESEFKQSISDPNAPNVLVATPTLEMGIDIGDLSAVLLASLPKTVASYLQRVGRAGRLTGSALNLAFITGRGEQLPRLEDPLSVINGAGPPARDVPVRRGDPAAAVRRPPRRLLRPRGEPAAPAHGAGALGSAEAGSFLGELIRLRRGRAPTVTWTGSSAASTAWPGRGRRTCGPGRPQPTASRTQAAWPRTCTTRRSAGRRRSRGSRTGGPPSRRRCPSSAQRGARRRAMTTTAPCAPRARRSAMTGTSRSG